MSEQREDGGAAFPSQPKWWDPDYMAYKEGDPVPGMTLRDYFAAHAPEPPKTWRGGERSLTYVIEWRWWYADAMLKARQS